MNKLNQNFALSYNAVHLHRGWTAFLLLGYKNNVKQYPT